MESTINTCSKACGWGGSHVDLPSRVVSKAWLALSKQVLEGPLQECLLDQELSLRKAYLSLHHLCPVRLSKEAKDRAHVGRLAVMPEMGTRAGGKQHRIGP